MIVETIIFIFAFAGAVAFLWWLAMLRQCDHHLRTQTFSAWNNITRLGRFTFGCPLCKLDSEERKRNRLDAAFLLFAFCGLAVWEAMRSLFRSRPSQEMPKVLCRHGHVLPPEAIKDVIRPKGAFSAWDDRSWVLYICSQCPPGEQMKSVAVPEATAQFFEGVHRPFR